MTHPDFSRRSDELELMDADGVRDEEFCVLFRELALINRYLGGHAATLGALDALTPPNAKRLNILDVGCGDGETSERIADWARGRGIAAEVTGIDLSEAAIRLAERRRRPGLSFFRRNLFELPAHETYDIVHAELMLHHCPGDEAKRALKAMHARSRLGVAINDLHRHPLAYHAIKALTRVFSRSRLVRYDAPLSVLRGFLKPELEDLCRRAGIPAPEIRRRWAFRWQMAVRR
jgi:2-polyprenyl-3-methyl-5-hydroxy-6-metoxy-1,4-benzoquinol methylase